MKSWTIAIVAVLLVPILGGAFFLEKRAPGDSAELRAQAVDAQRRLEASVRRTRRRLIAERKQQEHRRRQS